MSAYTQPILRFGFITPVLFNCVLLGGVIAANYKLSEVKKEKEARYAEQVARLAAIKRIESEITPKKATFENQKRLLAIDPAQVFTNLLDVTLPKYEDIELERTSLIFPLDKGRLGRTLKVNCTTVKGSFEGGVGPMQETLLQVESLMPQAVLEDMKITRKPADLLLNKPEHLVFDLSYTCWKTAEGKQ